MKDGGVQTCLADAAWLAGWPTPVTVPDSDASHGQLSGDYRRSLAVLRASRPRRDFFAELTREIYKIGGRSLPIML